MRQQEVEPSVRVQIQLLSARHASPDRRLAARRRRRAPGVQIEPGTEQVAIADSLLGQVRAIEAASHQLGHLIHQFVHRKPWPIPFQQREFRMVPMSAFVVAKNLADLIDRPAARGQQAFHRKLGGGVQPARGACSGGLDAKALQGRIGDRVPRQDRCFHLQHGAFGEVGADAGQHPRTRDQHLGRRARSPAAAALVRGHSSLARDT